MYWCTETNRLALCSQDKRRRCQQFKIMWLWWRGKQLWRTTDAPHAASDTPATLTPHTLPVCTKNSILQYDIRRPVANTGTHPHTHIHTWRILNAATLESTDPTAIDMPPLLAGFLTANVTAASASATAYGSLLAIACWLLTADYRLLVTESGSSNSTTTSSTLHSAHNPATLQFPVKHRASRSCLRVWVCGVKSQQWKVLPWEIFGWIINSSKRVLKMCILILILSLGNIL